MHEAHTALLSVRKSRCNYSMSQPSKYSTHYVAHRAENFHDWHMLDSGIFGERECAPNDVRLDVSERR